MEIQIGCHKIGDNCPAFIVAEMSGNHNGSKTRAIEIIHSAKRSGASAIKLQTYRPDTITLNCSREDFLIPEKNPWSNHNTLWKLYNKAHTPWEWHEELFSEARSIGLEVFSSPFDESAVDMLQRLDASAYKIASPEITHIPLLETVAKTGKPVILSSGVAELSDLELAIATLRDNGCEDIVILKCTSAYPAPIEETNLNTIIDIKHRFGVLSGLSDHTLGNTVALASVAIGASMIEKHLNLNDDENTVDDFFSCDENTFSSLVKEIRLVEKAMGRPSYNISSSALPSIRGRRSMYVSRKIKRGEIFSDTNIKIVRPSFGLHPKYYKDVIGRKAKRDLEVGERLSWDVVQ